MQFRLRSCFDGVGDHQVRFALGQRIEDRGVVAPRDDRRFLKMSPVEALAQLLLASPPPKPVKPPTKPVAPPPNHRHRRRDRVEARCLGVSGTNEGGQEQAGEKAGSKPHGRLKDCKGHGNLGPPLQERLKLRHRAVNLNWRALSKAQGGVHSRRSNRNGRTGPSRIEGASG